MINDKRVLIGIGDEYFMKPELKNEELEKVKDSQLFESNPLVCTNYIKDTYYSDAINIENALFIESYPQLHDWIPILDECYRDIKEKYDNNIELYDEFTEALPMAKFVFLPSDCYYCT